MNPRAPCGAVGLPLPTGEPENTLVSSPPPWTARPPRRPEGTFAIIVTCCTVLLTYFLLGKGGMVVIRVYR